ncbi:SAV_2336 N-terminal domain-related protein [Almyronema epifaneia]|uniref:SAV_2336 N-terminal domain-related protein n=1 Tax=Almyronema epifaneia S1 TaxID=2991925 RepID=A0ABW6IJH9_9CYAN
MRPGNPKVEDIDGLATLLTRAGVDFGVEDVADALWLAGHMGDLAAGPSQQNQPTSATNQTNIREEFIEADETEAADPVAQLSLPKQPSQKQTGGQSSDSGIPIKAPAAPALRIRLELARSLRPLRQTVSSPGRLEFDEAATVERIADQRTWSPVLKPAPERWLDVALVVEDMRSLPLWEETIEEFQTLLERQGAFRRVTTWRLQAETDQPLKLFPNWRDPVYRQRPRQAKQLWDPARRRLILLLSDCTSEVWYTGKLLSWLETYGRQAPTAVVQLLPERLWSQTALGQGTPVWLKTVERGTVTANLTTQYRIALLQQLIAKPVKPMTVPVVPLEAEPMKQWAKLVAGSGESRAVGLQFDLSKEEKAGGPEVEESEPSPQERVQRFWTTASLMAQRLAGLMSAAPVSPPIVNLIRQTLLPKAEPVHVAEVYMGGLMEVQPASGAEDTKTTPLQYDFADGVRNVVSDVVSKRETESVLDAVSRYIADRLNLSTKNFEALLRLDFQGDPEAEDIVIPFAKVAAQTLERMGGEYAAIAEQLATAPKVPPPLPVPNPNDLFPLLQTFTFREAILELAPGVEPSPDSQPNLPTYELHDFAFETVSLQLQPARLRTDDFASILPELQRQMVERAEVSLDEIQIAFLQGAWNGETYNEIAAHLPAYSPGELKQEIAAPLWRLLSTILGAKVNKSVLKSVLTDWAIRPQLTLQRQQRQGQQLIEDLGQGVVLEMVLVPAGSFVMGSPETEKGRSDDEGPQHEVTFAASFLMAKYPITQAQWRVVAALPQVGHELASDPSSFKGDNCPVETITWYDAVEFCARLSQHTGRDYRLPSEAEWEYACRAGTTTPFHFGETITTDLANYDGNYAYGAGPKGQYREQTTEVGSFPANAFGLHNMHGNVWEWCQDHWHDNYDGAPTDGSAWLFSDESKYRILRGGSWDDDPGNCRSASRGRFSPGLRLYDVGLRVVCGVART